MFVHPHYNIIIILGGLGEPVNWGNGRLKVPGEMWRLDLTVTSN